RVINPVNGTRPAPDRFPGHAGFPPAVPRHRARQRAASHQARRYGHRHPGRSRPASEHRQESTGRSVASARSFSDECLTLDRTPKRKVRRNSSTPLMATSGRNNKAPEYGALEDALVAEGQSAYWSSTTAHQNPPNPRLYGAFSLISFRNHPPQSTNLRNKVGDEVGEQNQAERNMGKLNPKQVENLTDPGTYEDGEGLRLAVRPT